MDFGDFVAIWLILSRRVFDPCSHLNCGNLPNNLRNLGNNSAKFKRTLLSRPSVRGVVLVTFAVADGELTYRLSSESTQNRLQRVAT